MKQCGKCGFLMNDECSVCPACGSVYGVKETESVSPSEVTASNDSQSIFIKGADLINDEALYNAGICKLNGLGMEKDENEAMEIFRILAFRGYTDGMYKLADMYLSRIPPNEEVAKNWLKVAAENGHVSSRIRLKTLGESISTVNPVKRSANCGYDSADGFEDKVQAALPCVLSINSVCTADSHIVSSHGSGFVINGGFVISNAHVIGENPESVVAKFDPDIDVKEYNLVPLKVVPEYDVAVLRFKGLADEKIAARQNLELRSDEVKRGEEVYTIGNPLVLGLSLSKGVVSSPKREYRYNYRKVSSVIQTDITINHGNSGGALLDKDNNVLGIMTFVPGASEGGIGIAVPSDYIEKVLDTIDKGE